MHATNTRDQLFFPATLHKIMFKMCVDKMQIHPPGRCLFNNQSVKKQEEGRRQGWADRNRNQIAQPQAWVSSRKGVTNSGDLLTWLRNGCFLFSD